MRTILCLCMLLLFVGSQLQCSEHTPQQDSLKPEPVSILESNPAEPNSSDTLIRNEISSAEQPVADANGTEFHRNESKVEEATAPDDFSQFPEVCRRIRSHYGKVSCLTPYIEWIVERQSSKAAMCKVMTLWKSGLLEDCHLLSHVVGKASLKALGDPGKAMQECPLDCIQGCIHGVMEAHIQALEKDGKLSDSALLTLCDSQRPGTTAYQQCVHGLGHGLLAHSWRTLKQAVALCEASKKQAFQEDCLSGVFMENFDRYSMLDKDSLNALLPTLCEPVRSKSTLLEACVASLGEGIAFYTQYQLTEGNLMCQTLKKSLGQNMVLVCEHFLKTEIENSKNRPSEPEACQ